MESEDNIMNIQKAWTTIVKFTNPFEPRVNQYHDAEGNSYYRAVNPMTRQSTTVSSEQEIRIWLDQQHY
jgi:hypothetical protein